MTAPEQPVTLASLDELKQKLGITRNVHDVELELYLRSASNMVRNRVVIDPSAIPPEATLATLLIAEQLWETRRVEISDDEVTAGRTGFAIPRRAEQALFGLPQVRRNTHFAGSI
jgi:hypothetical protein